MTNRAQQSEFRRYGILLGLVYLVVYGWMFIASNGIPFVMDGNESFSVFWHAYNLYHFDFSKSLGLTDESFSPFPDAHPFLHTHQGNMPRLFGFLIFVLGARSIESQIIVTTLVIGSLTAFVTYRFFSRAVNPLFGFIFTILLITDYILFAQWNVVTYRVWHGALVFSILLALYEYKCDGKNRWLCLLFFSYLLTFYYELVFAGLLTILGFLYAIFLYRTDWKRLFSVAGVAAVGGLIALVVLTVQLVAVLGAEVAFRDFYITFFARNAAGAEEALRIMREFYSQQNIAFWYNVFNAAPYRAVVPLIHSVSTINFQTYTPVLTLAAFVSLVGWCLSYLVRFRPKVRMPKFRDPILPIFLPVLLPQLFFALMAVWLRGFGADVNLVVLTLFFLFGFGMAAAVYRAGRLGRELARLRACPERAADALRVVALVAFFIGLLVLPVIAGRRSPTGVLAVVTSLPYFVFAVSALGVTGVYLVAGVFSRRALGMLPASLPHLTNSISFRRRFASALVLAAIFVIPLIVVLVVSISGLLPSAGRALSMLAFLSGGVLVWYLLPRLLALWRHGFPRLVALWRHRLSLTRPLIAMGMASLSERLLLFTGTRCLRAAVGALLALAPFIAFALGALTLNGASAPVLWPVVLIALVWSAVALLVAVIYLQSWEYVWANAATILLLAISGLALAVPFYFALGGSIIFVTLSDAPLLGGVTSMALAVMASFAAIVVYARRLTGRWTDTSWLSWREALGLVVLGGAVLVLAWKAPALYQPEFEPIWAGILGNPVARWAGRLFLVAVIASAGMLVVSTRSEGISLTALRNVKPAIFLLFAGGFAYLVIFMLSPGYVLTGYQWRHTPFSVFTTNILLALAFYLLACTLRSQVKPIDAENSLRLGWSFHHGFSYVGIAAGAIYWCVLQANYVGLLPPDHYAFLHDLSREPYRGQSFVVNNYAAPVAAMTGSWAYYDPMISGGSIKKSSEGDEMIRDPESYLWFADRYNNEDYLEPKYYVCMVAQNFTTVLGKFTGNSTSYKFNGCSSNGIVASTGRVSAAFNHKIVAMDAPSDDYWAILELDLEVPPWLDKFPGLLEEARVELNVGGTSQAPKVRLNYFVLGEGESEDDVQIFIASSAGGCRAETLEWAEFYSGPAGKDIVLPSQFSGRLVAFVKPVRNGLGGSRYNSPIVIVESGQQRGICSESIVPPMPTFVSENVAGHIHLSWVDSTRKRTTKILAYLSDGVIYDFAELGSSSLQIYGENTHNFEGISLSNMSYIGLQNCIEERCSSISMLPLALGITNVTREGGVIRVTPARKVEGLEYTAAVRGEPDNYLYAAGYSDNGEDVVFPDYHPNRDIVIQLQNCRSSDCYSVGKPVLLMGRGVSAKLEKLSSTSVSLAWNIIDRSYQYRVALYAANDNSPQAGGVLPLGSSNYVFGGLDQNTEYVIRLKYCTDLACQDGQEFRFGADIHPNAAQRPE